MSDRIRGTDTQFDFRICALCELGFVDPVPSDDELATLYGSDYAYFGDAPAPSRAMGWKFAVAALRYRHFLTRNPVAVLRAAIAKAVEGLSGKTITYSLGLPLALPKSARILEIGCGSGYWLLEMKRRGYNHLHGFDIALNRDFRDRLEEAGIAAYNDVELAAVPGASFELVRLEHVFEHLPDPRSELARIHRLLVPGGWLVMTFPSILPWIHRPDIAESPDLAHLQLPRHLTHHSPESARRLLVEASFDVVGLRVTQREKFITVAAKRGESR